MTVTLSHLQPIFKKNLSTRKDYKIIKTLFNFPSLFHCVDALIIVEVKSSSSLQIRPT